MRIKKCLTYTILTMICFLAIVNTDIAGQESNATLQETVDWLKSKTDLIVAVGAHLPKLESSIYYDITFELNSSAKGEFIWRNQKPPKKPSPSKRVDMPRLIKENVPTEIAVSLSDLNPDKVEVSSIKSATVMDPDRTWWQVKLTATNARPLIRWQGIEGEAKSEYLILVFEEKEMAERIARAFRHGIKLSGGKTDTAIKEPF